VCASEERSKLQKLLLVHQIETGQAVERHSRTRGRAGHAPRVSEKFSTNVRKP